MTRRLGAGLAGAAALIAVITIGSRVVGFGRWLVYSQTVSGLCVGNAYSSANQVPNVLFEVAAGGALAGAVVPLLAGPLARAAGAEVDRIVSALLTWTVLVLVPVAAALALASGAIGAALVDEEVCPGGGELAGRFLLVFAPQVVFYGVGVVLAGVLTARHRFVGPALGPLVSSLIVIGAYLAFAVAVGPGTEVRNDAADLPAAGGAWLAWGTTAGVAVMTLPLLIPVLASGVRIRPTLRFPDGVARRALSLAGAGVAGLLAQQASVVAVLALQRESDDAATLNIFQYTQAVYLLPYAILVVPLATAAFPRLSKHAATGDSRAYAAAVAVTTRAVLAMGIIGAAVLVAVAGPVAEFFAHLDRADVGAMGPTLIAMAPGLIGFGLIAHVGRALYALERGRAAAAATVTGWLVVTAVMVVLGRLLSGSTVATGLGAANSVGMTVAGLGLLYALRRHAGSPALAGVGRSGAVVCLVSSAGALVGWFVGDRLADQWARGLLEVVVAGIAAAAACLTVVLAGLLLADREDLRLLLRRGRAVSPTTAPLSTHVPEI